MSVAESKTRSRFQLLARRAVVVLVLSVLGLACAVSAATRMSLPLPAGLSCQLPTPQSCLTTLVGLSERIELERLIAPGQSLARENPANAKVQAFLALTYTKLGNADEADRYFLNAARLGWRNLAGQTYSYYDSVSAGEYDRALLHLDAMLRLDRSLAKNLPLMAPVWQTPELRSGFARRLALEPTYLQSFLAGFNADQETDWEGRLATLSEAHEAGLSPNPVQYRDIVWAGFGKDPWKALEFWAALNGRGDWAEGSLAWNSAKPPWPLASSATPFAWHYRTYARSPAEIELREGKAFVALIRDRAAAVQELAAIAVPLKQGVYPIVWSDAGGAGALFLSASCSKGRDAEIRKIANLGEGHWSGELVVGPACPMPMISVLKSSGMVKAGSRLGEIRIGGLTLLD